MQGGGEERRENHLSSCLPSRHNLLLCGCVCWRIKERKVKIGREMPAGLLKSLCFCCKLLAGRVVFFQRGGYRASGEVGGEG